MSVNVMPVTLLSESLVHVMFGVGLPPSVTAWFPEISAMVGGSAKQQERVH